MQEGERRYLKVLKSSRHYCNSDCFTSSTDISCSDAPTLNDFIRAPNNGHTQRTT